MNLAIYFDDDFVKSSRADDLRSAGFDVVIPRDAGTAGFADPDHLEQATRTERILVSHNVADFHRIHTDWMLAGLHHAGIVLVHQRPILSSSEIVRRFLAMDSELANVGARDQILFLSNFG